MIRCGTIGLGRFDLFAIEEEARRFWKTREIPRKWRSWEEGRPIFAFLEGPPTANGYPHVGHIRGRVFKDFVLKYMRLKGYNVWAQAGWDEQGLPVEVEAEKKLGIKKKKDIFQVVGAERFVEECNKLVDYYLKYWQDYATERIALWLDLENAYETRKPEYIEHVWYFIKRMHEKGLLYEGKRVLPFCPRCETALSDAEVSQGYEDKVSPSIYVKFKLENRDNEYLVIWTTTPWTLIDNEAVAVNPDGVYCRTRVGNEYWFVAESRLEEVMRNAGAESWKCVEKVKGSELEGLRYVHPLLEEVPIHIKHENAHYVITADFVSLEEGTGLVHIAPGHGPEDYEVGTQYGLPISSAVEINGVFNSDGGIFKGLDVNEASKKVTEVLREKGLLVYEGTIVHKYPHCWRCGTPLIYRADKQWFIRVSPLRSELLRALADVAIYPKKLRARFENWLENLKDWTISRSRIWGTPLPVWVCKDNPKKVKVIGSIEELKKEAEYVPDVDDFRLVHRPWIDRVKLRPTEDCKEWVRVPFVVDVWMDSGMAWMASVDGLRNKKLFSMLYPYHFITEGVDQTRGWFYSLLVTSVLLEGKAPYRTILMQGLVLDAQGRKMSKHLGNVIWAKDLLTKYSVDATRAYILVRYPPAESFIFNLKEIRDIVRNLNIIWNVFKFADTYMSIDKYDPSKHDVLATFNEGAPEDRWVISETNTLLRRFDELMREYRLHEATKAVLDFFVETLSHGYLRMIRPRVWSEESLDRFHAYTALYYALKTGLQLLSTIAPHMAEKLWQEFIKKYEPSEAESVHLSRLSEPSDALTDEDIEMLMKVALGVISSAASLRNEVKIKLRWPIQYVKVGLPKDYVEGLKELKHIIRLLANSKDVIIVSYDELECGEDEISEETKVDNVPLKTCINRKLTSELRKEALAREIIRRIQTMRNSLNLKVDELIDVYVRTEDSEISEALNEHREYVASEVRARNVVLGEGEADLAKEWVVEGRKVWIGIKRLRS